MKYLSLIFFLVVVIFLSQADCVASHTDEGQDEVPDTLIEKAICEVRAEADKHFDASRRKADRHRDSTANVPAEESSPLVYDPSHGVPLQNVLKRGGKVHLPAGDYEIPPIDVTRRLSLSADEGATLTIRSKDKASDPYGIRLQADQSRIEGVAIVRTGGRAGITIEADDCVVRDCIIFGENECQEGAATPYGVWIRQTCARTVVAGNSITNAGVGILASRFTEALYIADNKVGYRPSSCALSFSDLPRDGRLVGPE